MQLKSSWAWIDLEDDRHGSNRALLCRNDYRGHDLPLRRVYDVDARLSRHSCRQRRRPISVAAILARSATRLSET